LVAVLIRASKNGSIHHCFGLGVVSFQMIFAQPEMDKVLIGLIPTMPNLLYTSP
jgi:hypothetical protein